MDERSAERAAGDEGQPSIDRSVFVGEWTSVDPWRTEVSFIISEENGSYAVRVVDKSDGEEGDVYEVAFSQNIDTEECFLTFGVHFSSGQFTKYRLRRLGDQLDSVFTYTDTTHYKRA